jgi:catechol 2,3-dioxygenase-like lactoylglutathione lyase family enzyme
MSWNMPAPRGLLPIAAVAAFFLGAAPVAAFPLGFASAAISVTNLDRSAAFYTEVVGLRRAPLVDHPSVVFVNRAGSLDGNDPFIELVPLLDKTPLVLGNGLTKLIIFVTDAKTVVERARAGHFTIVSEYKAASQGGVAFIKDPDGYTLEIYELSAPSPVK